MKLYLTPGACSLADHIALHEAGLSFERVNVDLKTRRTSDGADFTKVNAKGYVPTLVLDDGQVLTENAAILFWIAQQAPQLAPQGPMGQVRLVEMLAYIATELHKTFGRIRKPSSDDDARAAKGRLAERLQFLADRLSEDHLFGPEFSVADAYLYVMLRWTLGEELLTPPPLKAYVQRVEQRAAVRAALRHEGLRPVTPAEIGAAR